MAKSAGRQTEVGQWMFKRGQRENTNQRLPAALGGNGGFQAVFQKRGIKNAPMDTAINQPGELRLLERSFCWCRGCSSSGCWWSDPVLDPGSGEWHVGMAGMAREGCAGQSTRATGRMRCDKCLLLHSWSCTCLPQCSGRACS